MSIVLWESYLEYLEAGPREKYREVAKEAVGVARKHYYSWSLWQTFINLEKEVTSGGHLR